MRKLVLAFGILVSVVSVSLGAMSKEEWDRANYNCLDNEDKSACQALINRGLASVEQCNKDSCAFVGAVYGAAWRYREAIPYFEKAIALGDNRGYRLLGKAYYLLQDYYNAKKYYEIECDTNDVASMQAYACLVVAEMYDRGQGVKRNSSTAAQYYHKACNLGDQRACSAIEAKRFEDMLRYLPESKKAMLESEKLELELKKLELERLELEQKLQKYK